MKVALLALAAYIGVLYGQGMTGEFPDQYEQLAAMTVGRWLCVVYDLNKDGVLAEQQETIDSTDEDGDGQTTRDEFVRSWLKKDGRLHENWIGTIFDWIDTSKDGILTMEDSFVEAQHDPETNVLLIKDCIPICADYFLEDKETFKQEIMEQIKKHAFEINDLF